MDQTTIKYEAVSFFGPKIRKVEVVSETESRVYLEEDEGDYRHKISPGRKYCDTFDEAKKFLVEHFTKQTAHYRRCFENAKNYLDDAKGIKEK